MAAGDAGQAATATAGARRSDGHAAPMHGSRPEREASHPTKEARQEGKVHSSSDGENDHGSPRGGDDPCEENSIEK